MLENTEGAIKKGQPRETGNIGYTRRRKTQHNMCWTPLCTNNVDLDFSKFTFHLSLNEVCPAMSRSFINIILNLHYFDC